MPINMRITPARYKALRESIGTQAAVARRLGVTIVALSRRENGARPVSREAWLALQYLTLCPEKDACS